MSFSNKKHFWVFFFFVNFTTLYNADVTYSTGTTLTADLRLSLSQRAIFNATLTLDGAGYFYQFPITATDQVLVVNNTFTATLQNILLRDFCIGHLSLGSGSAILFGDNTYFSMTKDFTIASGSPAINFNGNAEINGNGATLTIDKSQGITITGSSKTLTLKNMRLVTSTVDAIKCLTSTCKIKLQNVEWVVLNGFTFSAGNCDVSGTVKITGDSSTFDGYISWEFSSSGIMTVTNSSELIIGHRMRFRYNADPTGAANFAATKRKFLLNQTASKLVLVGASLESTGTGLALDQGTLLVYDDVNITTTNASYGALEIGTNVSMKVVGTLNVNGIIKYTGGGMPLLYGDGVSLQHTNYNTYIGGNTFGQPYTVAYSSIADSNTKWYVQPGDTNYRWGNPSVAGNPVLCGDMIKLENYLTGHYASNTAEPIYLYASYASAGGQHLNSNVSNPYPPYSISGLFPRDNSDGSFNNMFRIHKLGGVIGEPILGNDVIYLVNYDALNSPYGTDTLKTLKYYYIGSSNMTVSTAFEVYSYEVSTSARPSNLTTNLCWRISNIYSAAYLTAATKNDPQSQATTIAYATMATRWPDAVITQF